VKSGTIFDNILVTDSKEEAATFRAETYGASKDAEKAMFEAEEKKRTEKEEAERKAAEEARKAAEKATEDEDEDDDDEDHDEL